MERLKFFYLFFTSFSPHFSIKNHGEDDDNLQKHRSQDAKVSAGRPRGLRLGSGVTGVDEAEAGQAVAEPARCRGTPRTPQRIAKQPHA